MNFDRYIEEYINDSKTANVNILNCLNYLKNNDDLMFTSAANKIFYMHL